ncbi:hypothetical protein D3C87_1520250 [compost metagenome]
MPSVVALPVLVRRPSRYMTPASRRTLLTGSPNTFSSKPRLRCMPSTAYTPVTGSVSPLGRRIWKALKVAPMSP